MITASVMKLTPRSVSCILGWKERACQARTAGWNDDATGRILYISSTVAQKTDDLIGQGLNEEAEK